MLKLFPSEAGQAFKLLWPIVDKSQQRDFRKFVTDKFVQLQKDRELPPTPPVRASVIDNPVGPKFCQLLLQASQLIMKRQIKIHRPNTYAQPAPFKRCCSASLIRICQLHIIRERDLFLKSVSDTIDAQNQWKCYVEKLVSFYNEVQAQLSDYISKYESLIGEFGADFMTERSMTEREKLSGCLENEWLEIRNVLDCQADMTVIDSILFRNAERPRFPDKSDKGESSTSPPELAALLKRWAACISQLQRHLTRNSACRISLERLADGEVELRRLAAAIADQREQIAGLSSRLEAYIGDLEQSIASLQIKVRDLRPVPSPSTVLRDHKAPQHRLSGAQASKGEFDDFGVLFCMARYSQCAAAVRSLLKGAASDGDGPDDDATDGWLNADALDVSQVAGLVAAVECAALRRAVPGEEAGGRSGATKGRCFGVLRTARIESEQVRPYMVTALSVMHGCRQAHDYVPPSRKP